MQDIASLLDKDNDPATREIWNDLEKSCRLSGIRLSPTPHFTWFGCDYFVEDETINAIEEISCLFDSFIIHTTGVGIFTTSTPVLYLPIIKSKKLLEMHEVIWGKLSKYGKNVSKIYEPELWIPHITLAHNELSAESLTCAVENFLNKPLDLQFKVDNLALIYATTDSSGIIHQTGFGKEEK